MLIPLQVFELITTTTKTKEFNPIIQGGTFSTYDTV